MPLSPRKEGHLRVLPRGRTSRTLCSVKRASRKGQVLCDSTSVGSREDWESGAERRGVLLRTRGVSLWDAEKILRVDGGDGYVTLNTTKLH